MRSHDGADQACRIIRLERSLARQHFVKHEAEREYIAARVDRFPLKLLRRHVSQGSGDRTGNRDRHRSGVVAAGQRLPHLRETEIE